MAKEVYSPSEIWVVSASYLPEKHTSSFSFSFQPSLWSWFWVFWNKKHASDFLLGSHLTVPNQSNKNGSQHSQNTIPWHFFFFSWNGTLFPRSVFTKLQKRRATCSYEPWNWGLMAKEAYVHCWGLRVADLNLPEKHVGSFLSLLPTFVGSQKKQGNSTCLERQPTPVFLPRKSHGREILEGYKSRTRLLYGLTLTSICDYWKNCNFDYVDLLLFF